MATQIVSQVVEYDNSARAWGRYNADGELIHYYDLAEDAIYAALPADLRAWIDTRQHLDGDASRALRAAALIANGEIIPDPVAYGIYSVAYTREENGMRYAGQHLVDARRRTCTCEDKRYRSAWCKHLLAAKYLFDQWQAEHMPRRATLHDLARQCIEAHADEDDWQPQIIWQSGDGSRHAMIIQGHLGKPDDPLWLHLSGHACQLMVGKRNYDEWPKSTWHFIDNPDAYREWCSK